MRTLAVALLLFSAPWGAIASSAQCPQAREDAAFAAAGRLTDWPAVAEYYRRYRACDEGAMAEASSEAITQLLSQHWEALPALGEQVRESPKFLKFVEWHINSTDSDGDIRNIGKLATDACPHGQESLCRALRRAAEDAYK